MTDYVFCIYQIIVKKWKYCGAVPELYKEFNKPYD